MVNADCQVQKNALGHQRIEGPWSRIQIDYIGPFPTTSRGNKYCLVIADPFSKWVEAIPTKTSTAWVTAKQLFNIVFSSMGIPRVIDSDSGSHFVGDVMQELCKALGIKQCFHIAGHPESSGQVERTNRTLKEALKKQVKSSGRDWDEKLPLILMSLRGSKA
ncbi:hypothetical protein G0U57_017193, partial [Chelydra serpentina]